MDMPIPDTAAIRKALQDLSYAQVNGIAAASGVPFTTLWKIRTEETKNPGLETVRRFWPHVKLISSPVL